MGKANKRFSIKCTDAEGAYILTGLQGKLRQLKKICLKHLLSGLQRRIVEYIRFTNRITLNVIIFPAQRRRKHIKPRFQARSKDQEILEEGGGAGPSS